MRWFLFALLLCLPTTAFAADAMKGSGLPVPRFVSLKSDDVNLRTGPGTRYPIQWVMKRDGWPVEITEEYEHWRKIRDSEGTTGWVHKTMIDGKRFAIIKGEKRVMRADPEEDARAVLRLEPKVVVRVVACKKEWCKLQVAGQKGWIKKAHLWGVYDKETFD